MLRSASQSPQQRESLADRIASRNLRSRSVPGGDRGLRDCNRVASRWSSGKEIKEYREMNHEGWLAKRSSGKISGRWQQRYFRLEGCFLRYMQSPASAIKKSFDLRKLCRLSADGGQELELDFGFRSWRLRSADVASARRWMVLLEAARLTGGAGEDVSECEDSDEESTSCAVSSILSITTATSTASEPEPSTPKFGSKAKPQPAITEVLEVDCRLLDQQFSAWLPFLQEQMVFGDRSAAAVADGLSFALRHLWALICRVADDEVPEAPLEASQAAERAMLAIASQGASHKMMRESLDRLIGEFLSRMQQAVEEWLQMIDPGAEDLSHLSQWLLFEARPAIIHFCDAAESFAGRLEHSRTVHDSLEKLSLREWESRSCEESAALFAQIFEGYGEAVPDVASALRRLGAAAALWRRWRGHVEATERAASVLVASLNAALRSQRAAVQPLRQEVQIFILTRKRRRSFRRTLQDFQKMGACGEKSYGCSEEVLHQALQDAVQLGSFCRSAAAEPGFWASETTTAMCVEVLSSFAKAFESEVSSLAEALVSVHATSHGDDVRIQRFSTGEDAGVLTHAARGWARFLETLPGNVTLHPCRRAAVALMANTWTQHLIRFPPRGWSASRMLSVLQADEAAAIQVERGERGEPGAPELERFVAVLAALRRILRNGKPEWEDLANAEAELQRLLDEDTGRALAQAFWQAVSQ